MDSTPPDRTQIRHFFGLSDNTPDSDGQQQVGNNPAPAPAMQTRTQRNPWSERYEWRNGTWLTDTLQADTTSLTVVNPPTAEGSSDEDDLLGGDFSLSDLIRSLPCDRLESGAFDLQDLPPISALCVQQSSESTEPTGQTQTSTDKVAKLIADGANPRECDLLYGRTPLHWACIYADLSVIRLLCNALKASALPNQQQHVFAAIAQDINRPDFNGMTPLHAALSLRHADGHAEIIEYLIQQGADPACLPNHGAELLFAGFLTVDIARVALAAGVPVDVRNHLNSTPLMRAALTGNLPVVKFLLEQGADPNQPIFFGGTVMNHYGLSAEVAELLIQAGADVNRPDDLGMTPLMFACQDKNLPLIRLLLRRGASMQAVSVDDMTVWEYAQDPETIRFLEQESGLVPGVRLATD